MQYRPLPANKPELIRGLATRLGLEPGAVAGMFDLLPYIVAVTHIDRLLRVVGTYYDGKDISAGAGTAVTYDTVPNGKRRYVIFVNKEDTTAATRIWIRHRPGTQTFDLFAPATAQTVAFTNDLRLEEGDTIGMFTTGNGADSDRHLGYWYEEEDAY